MLLSRIIGIAGVTNGGKTTICRKLLQSLQNESVRVTHFNMDDYFWAEESENHKLLPAFNNTYADWDTVGAVDWSRMMADVKTWTEEKPKDTDNNIQQRVLLIEGILIFNHKPLLDFFDKKYFLMLTKDQCWERRKERIYLPPEPEGYFEQIAWPRHLEYKVELDAISNIVYHDGTRSQDDIFKEVMSDIKQLLSGDS